MSKANYRKVFGKKGSGRFVVSEYPPFGCGPYPLPELATPDDDMFEIVINPGSLLPPTVADLNAWEVPETREEQ